MTNPERAQDKQDADEIKNYTRTPNMLIFGYSELSPQEKWLYVCLKHLCGKRGTRYLSLRFISEQTGISVGALSSSKDKNGKVNEGMVRHLHDAGLIHSEIKKREGRGNAQYHITITDVWALNQAFFIERNQTRSEFGQDENETSEPVRNSDAPVQNSDKLDRISDKPVQNSDEPVRNPGQLQDYSKTTNKISDKTDKQQGTYSAAESTPQPGADAQSAPDVPNVPYQPNFKASQGKMASENDAWQAYQQVQPQIASVCQALASNTPPAKSEQDSVTPELSTSLPPSEKAARAVAYQPPTRTRSGSRTTKGNTSNKIYFTTEGAAFRAWYEEIFEMQLDETAANARACNSLGKLASVTYENVKLVKREIDLNKWADTNNVAVTPQDLADDKSNIRWEKWLQSAQKRAKKRSAPTSAPTPKGDNNLADWVAEAQEQQAQVSPEESARQLEEARKQLAAIREQNAAKKAAERQQQALVYRVKGEAYV